jgi:hypothetical protein
MREFRTYGSVRGAHGNGRPYRDQAALVVGTGVLVDRGQAAISFSFANGIASRKVCIGVLPKHQRP